MTAEASERDRVRYGSTVIEYSVVRSPRRRKTVEITLDPGEGIVVAAPPAVPVEQVRAVVVRRAGWIIRHATAEVLHPRRKRFVSGESIPYLGRQVRLFVELCDVRRPIVEFKHWSFQIIAPVGVEGEERRSQVERSVLAWYRERARARLAERVGRWIPRAGIAPAGILIREQRQRWASCGPDGTLRFNWRIIMAPPALIDYVIVHELVHLRHRTHSAEFWSEVARLIPDFRLRRRRLKEIGPTLTL